jgi:hypothetical protein
VSREFGRDAGLPSGVSKGALVRGGAFEAKCAEQKLGGRAEALPHETCGENYRRQETGIEKVTGQSAFFPRRDYCFRERSWN